jgi:hypothetical protein
LLPLLPALPPLLLLPLPLLLLPASSKPGTLEVPPQAVIAARTVITGSVVSTLGATSIDPSGIKENAHCHARDNRHMDP